MVQVQLRRGKRLSGSSQEWWVPSHSPSPGCSNTVCLAGDLHVLSRHCGAGSAMIRQDRTHAWLANAYYCLTVCVTRSGRLETWAAVNIATQRLSYMYIQYLHTKTVPALLGALLMCFMTALLTQNCRSMPCADFGIVPTLPYCVYSMVVL